MPDAVAAITDLDTLLASLAPALSDEVFVFISVPDTDYGAAEEWDAVAAVREDEGLTLILPRARAEAAALSFDATFRRITLQVHSSLTAVGLTAAVATALARRGISANVVAGYHHDHVFVPSERAREAVAALEGFAGTETVR